EDTCEFIERHRERIIGDCLGVLQSQPYELATFSRWASWERDVLQRLPEPAEAQRVILDRQGECDVEGEEVDQLNEHIADQLRSLGYNPDEDHVLLPTMVVAEMFNVSMGKRDGTTSISRQIRQATREGRLRLLTESQRKDWPRGFIWRPTPTASGVFTDIVE